MIVYLNGEYIELDQARISPLDRGFLFGEGIYEGIRYFNGKPVGLSEHISRFRKGLKALNIQGVDLEFLKSAGEELVRQNHIPDAGLYWQITGGADSVRSHVPRKGLIPTVFGFAWQLTSLDDYLIPKEVDAVTYPDIRWLRCDIKSVNLLGSVLAKVHADNHNTNEAIFHRNGYVTEGSTTNVWMVKNGEISTPDIDENDSILSGVTRRMMIQADLQIQTRKITLQELQNADEIFLTSSMRLIVAVTSLDGKPVGNSKSGNICKRLNNALLEIVKQEISS